MKCISFLLFLGLLSATFCKAQSSAGKVEIVKDAKIDSLVKKHKIYLETRTSKGYRIQVFFGTDRSKSNEARANFLQKYPTISAYLVYQQPNFKVRVGDFKSRLEATKYVKQFNTDFGSAFIVHDDIK